MILWVWLRGVTKAGTSLDLVAEIIEIWGGARLWVVLITPTLIAMLFYGRLASTDWVSDGFSWLTLFAAAYCWGSCLYCLSYFVCNGLLCCLDCYCKPCTSVNLMNFYKGDDSNPSCVPKPFFYNILVMDEFSRFDSDGFSWKDTVSLSSTCSLTWL